MIKFWWRSRLPSGSRDFIYRFVIIILLSNTGGAGPSDGARYSLNSLVYFKRVMPVLICKFLHLFYS